MLEDIYGSAFDVQESLTDKYSNNESSHTSPFEQNSPYEAPVYDSPLESVLEGAQSSIHETEFNSQHTNAAFNMKGNNLGSIGVIDRMAGLVARREDMSFGDVTLAEMYKDKSLDSRAMGGAYNFTLSDIYLDKNRYLATQGMLTFGGMVTEAKEDTLISRVRNENQDLSNSLMSKDGGVFDKLKTTALLSGGVNTNESAFDVGRNDKYLTSQGVGNTGYLESGTIYEKKDTNLQKEETEKVSMHELMNNMSSSSIIEDQSIYAEKKEFTNLTKGKSMAEHTSEKRRSNEDAIFDSKPNVNMVKTEYLESTTQFVKKSATNKMTAKKLKMHDLIRNKIEENQSKEKKINKDENIDNLKANRAQNQERFESADYEEEEKRLNKEILPKKKKISLLLGR